MTYVTEHFVYDGENLVRHGVLIMLRVHLKIKHKV